MSRYTSAAVTHGDDNDDEDFEFAGNASRMDRDFLRRNLTQFHTIYTAYQRKFYKSTVSSRYHLQPHYNSFINIPFPPMNKSDPSNGICSHFLRRGYTKPIKHQLNTALWSADARWLVLGTQSGDFALWEGEQLKVHKVVSVPEHKVLADGGKVQDYIPITSMARNHHSNLYASGNNNGLIQYCDESFRTSFYVRDAHSGAVRGLCYSLYDSKLVSCSDDSTVKVWTVGRNQPDMTLTGHQSDVRCIDWHPYRSLIASGSRENVIKLWDPKLGRCVSTISSHKKSVLCCHWNQNGNWLATGAKDGLIKIFDIRIMREMENLRGHNADVCSLQWHPQYETLLLSGGYNGSLIYWLADTNQCAHTAIGDAHRQSIDVISWHPGGHLVATASHDCILKFWCREGPGSRIDAKLAAEITETQPPLYGYGPLPPTNAPAVIVQSTSSQQLAATSNTGSAQGTASGQAGARSSTAQSTFKFTRGAGASAGKMTQGGRVDNMPKKRPREY